MLQNLTKETNQKTDLKTKNSEKSISTKRNAISECDTTTI